MNNIKVVQCYQLPDKNSRIFWDIFGIWRSMLEFFYLFIPQFLTEPLSFSVER